MQDFVRKNFKKNKTTYEDVKGEHPTIYVSLLKGVVIGSSAWRSTIPGNQRIRKGSLLGIWAT